MDEEVKKDAEEEMNCILDLLEEWCLKYDQDYANAVVLVKHDQITSWGSIGDSIFVRHISGNGGSRHKSIWIKRDAETW